MFECVCERVCVCARAQEPYVFIKIYVNRLSSFPSTRSPVCVCGREKVCVWVWVCVRMVRCAFVCMCMCVCVCNIVCMSMCVCVCDIVCARALYFDHNFSD